MRSAAKTCAWITSTSGIRVAAAAPTQSASVETSSSMPSRAKASLWRLSGRCRSVFAEQDMGEQLGAGASARDRMRGSWWLRDRLARATRELLAHVLDHLPLARNQFQRLGHVLADLVQRPAATRAGRGHRIDDPLAR